MNSFHRSGAYIRRDRGSHCNASQESNCIWMTAGGKHRDRTETNVRARMIFNRTREWSKFACLYHQEENRESFVGLISTAAVHRRKRIICEPRLRHCSPNSHTPFWSTF